jgi:hypothetical protein
MWSALATCCERCLKVYAGEAVRVNRSSSTSSFCMCYVWLYLGKGAEGLLALANALSIPDSHVLAGDNAHLAASDLHHLHESGLHHFDVRGDFALSCDVRLAGWAIDAVHVALQRLSVSGLRIAMADDASDNPFAFVLFELGTARAVTVVQNDETGEVTLFPAPSR